MNTTIGKASPQDKPRALKSLRSSVRAFLVLTAGLALALWYLGTVEEDVGWRAVIWFSAVVGAVLMFYATVVISLTRFGDFDGYF